MRPGVRLGVDVGTVRVGLAGSDPAGVLATPLDTLHRQQPPPVLDRIAELVGEHHAVEVVVGLPRSLSGQEGPAASAARQFAMDLAEHVFPATVRLLDERLTTIDAHRVLRAARRPTRQHKRVVDQVAAVLILQAALDLERAQGRPPGEAVPAAQSRTSRGSQP